MWRAMLLKVSGMRCLQSVLRRVRLRTRARLISAAAAVIRRCRQLISCHLALRHPAILTLTGAVALFSYRRSVDGV